MKTNKETFFYLKIIIILLVYNFLWTIILNTFRFGQGGISINDDFELTSFKGGSGILLFFNILILGPIFETIIFNTIIQRIFIKIFFSKRWISVVVTSVLFSMAHGPHLDQMIYSLIGGSIFCIVFLYYYEKETRPTPRVILLHSIANATSILSLYTIIFFIKQVGYQ